MVCIKVTTNHHPFSTQAQQAETGTLSAGLQVLQTRDFMVNNTSPVQRKKCFPCRHESHTACPSPLLPGLLDVGAKGTLFSPTPAPIFTHSRSWGVLGKGYTVVKVEGQFCQGSTYPGVLLTVH